VSDTSGPAAPAGWYPHPDQADQIRYWDGSAWTSHTSPVETPPPGASGASPAAASSSREPHWAAETLSDPSSGSTIVANGMLKAVAVIVAFLLVAGLTLALVAKRHEMSSVQREGSHLYEHGLGANAPATQIELRSEQLGAEADKARGAAEGPLAGIAGDPGALRTLADRLGEESRRLADLAGRETQ